MSEQQAQLYDQLIREHTAIQNAINQIPELSIEEQSLLVSVSEKYTTENQEKVTQLKNKLLQIEHQLRNLF